MIGNLFLTLPPFGEDAVLPYHLALVESQITLHLLYMNDLRQ